MAQKRHMWVYFSDDKLGPDRPGWATPAYQDQVCHQKNRPTSDASVPLFAIFPGWAQDSPNFKVKSCGAFRNEP